MSEKCKCALDDACGDGLKPIHAASQCGHTNIIKVSNVGGKPHISLVMHYHKQRSLSHV